MSEIRFGVIGTNRITDWFLKGALQDSRFILKGVCSRSMDRARAFADSYNVPLAFDSPQAMAQCDEIDAVYIATPNSTHCELAIMFMNSGKHVLCEKPMASNAREVKLMIEASRRNNVVLMEAVKTTVMPGFRQVMSRIDEAGEVRRYFSSYCQYSSRYDRLKDGEVLNAFKSELSNGAVMDIGIYTIYPMVVLFGRPLSVNASGMLIYTGVDLQGSARFEYDGMTADVIYSKIVDSHLPSEIQGENGTISIEHINICDRVSFYPGRSDFPEVWSEAAENNSYYYEVAEFIDVIESGCVESKINSHSNSLITIELIDEIRRQIGVSYPADE